MYQRYVKRLLDILLSVAALIILSPVIGITALLVRLKLGSPVIFRQQRPGKDEKIFMMYKFRSMTNERDENGELLPNEKRLTKFGKLLRSTSLDELPELINIIKGEMSIIGPRPLPVIDLLFMTEEQRKRHMIAGGLTGLAQVNGRNCIKWENKFEFDLKYISDITFTGDFKIFLKTITYVFSRKGINSEGMETSENFGDYLLRTNRIEKDMYSEIITQHKILINTAGSEKVEVHIGAVSEKPAEIIEAEERIAM